MTGMLVRGGRGRGITTALRAAGLGLVALLGAASGCSGTAIAETEVDVVVSVDALEASETAPGVRITGAWVVLESVALVRCDATTRAWLQRAGALLVTPAWAHVESAPDRIGETTVVDLLDANALTALGTMRPMPGCYSAVEVMIGPADDDALGLDGTPMLGRSLCVEGSWVGPEGEAGFSLASEARRRIVLPLVDEVRVPGVEAHEVELRIDLRELAARVRPEVGRDGADRLLLALDERLQLSQR